MEETPKQPLAPQFAATERAIDACPCSRLALAVVSVALMLAGSLGVYLVVGGRDDPPATAKPQTLEETRAEARDTRPHWVRFQP